MAYRSDIEALEARYHALEADLAERTRERDEAASLLAEARTRAMHEAVIADLQAGGPARRRRQRAIVAAMVTAFAMAIGATGYHLARPHPRHGMERMLRRLAQFSDEMCACRDSACAMAVSDEMTRWAQLQVNQIEPPGRIDERTRVRATEIAEQLGSCMQHAMMSAPDVPSGQ